VAALLASSILFAQPSKIQPVSVGERFPLEAWQALQNGKDSTWRIADLDADLVILDFMSATCGSCYYAIPLLDSLQQHSPKVRSFIVMPDEDTARFYKNTRRILKRSEPIAVPLVANDSIIRRYFPYQLVSHIVWLNRQQEVIAITGSDYLKADSIPIAMSGKTLPWTLKEDVWGFDNNADWLTWNPEMPVKPDAYYYSVFTKEMVGIAPPTGFSKDEQGRIVRFALHNRSLVEFCFIALQDNGDIRKEDFLYTRAAYEKIFANTTGRRLRERPDHYSYSISFPPGINNEWAMRLIREDIRRWLLWQGISLIPLEKGADGKPAWLIDLVPLTTKP
jgi:thiol-disulfide isomerase/thioredoxin